MPQMQPFWDSNFTADNPGPYLGPLYSSNPWDTATVRGLQLPGIVTVSVRRQRHLWTIQAPGAPPVPIKAGYEPLKFSMKVKVWTPMQWQALQPIMWILEPITVKPPKGNGKQKAEDPNAAFDVVHPKLATFSVSACICESLGDLDGEGSAPRVLSIEFLEYRRNRNSVATVDKSIVADNFNAQAASSQTVSAANGRSVNYTPTQGPQQKPSQSPTLTPTP